MCYNNPNAKVEMFEMMFYCSEKQARAYGNLGVCYELLKQHTQALFCQTKARKQAKFDLYVY